LLNAYDRRRSTASGTNEAGDRQKPIPRSHSTTLRAGSSTTLRMTRCLPGTPIADGSDSVPCSCPLSLTRQQVCHLIRLSVGCDYICVAAAVQVADSNAGGPFACGPETSRTECPVAVAQEHGHASAAHSGNCDVGMFIAVDVADCDCYC